MRQALDAVTRDVGVQKGDVQAAKRARDQASAPISVGDSALQSGAGNATRAVAPSAPPATASTLPAGDPTPASPARAPASAEGPSGGDKPHDVDVELPGRGTDTTAVRERNRGVAACAVSAHAPPRLSGKSNTDESKRAPAGAPLSGLDERATQAIESVAPHGSSSDKPPRLLRQTSGRMPQGLDA